jgi:hypothetical protein
MTPTNPAAPPAGSAEPTPEALMVACIAFNGGPGRKLDLANSIDALFTGPRGRGDAGAAAGVARCRDECAMSKQILRSDGVQRGPPRRASCRSGADSVA